MRLAGLRLRHNVHRSRTLDTTAKLDVCVFWFHICPFDDSRRLGNAAHPLEMVGVRNLGRIHFRSLGLDILLSAAPSGRGVRYVLATGNHSWIYLLAAFCVPNTDIAVAFRESHHLTRRSTLTPASGRYTCGRR